MIEIIITSKTYGRKVVLVDDEEYERLKLFSWGVTKHQNGKFYARWRHTSMHRFILGLTPKDKRVVDHIDGNTLNNQKTNLRAVTMRENRLNSNWWRGVSIIERIPSGFRVKPMIYGRYLYLGTFKTEEEALAVVRRYKNAVSPA